MKVDEQVGSHTAERSQPLAAPSRLRWQVAARLRGLLAHLLAGRGVGRVQTALTKCEAGFLLRAGAVGEQSSSQLGLVSDSEERQGAQFWPLSQLARPARPNLKTGPTNESSTVRGGGARAASGGHVTACMHFLCLASC